MALQLRRSETRSFGKIIAASFAVLALAIQPLVALNAPAAFAVSATPSTNAINKVKTPKKWAHVNEVSKTTSSVTLELVSERAFNSCFEYRSDGNTSQATSPTNYNTMVADGLYPYACVSNSTKTITVPATNYVEVRMVFGSEGDERFDWTEFNTLPDKTAPKVQILSPTQSDIYGGNNRYATVKLKITDPNGVDLSKGTYVFFGRSAGLTGSAQSESTKYKLTPVAGEPDVYQAVIDTQSFVPVGSSGLYALNYRAQDNLGNGSSGAHFYMTSEPTRGHGILLPIDNAAPTAPVAALTDANGNSVTNGFINTGTFAFNLSSSSDTVRYQLKYWNDIAGSRFNGESNAWKPTDLGKDGYMPVLGVYKDRFSQGEGKHYFAFSACDAAGNCSAFSSPFAVTYDATAPVVTLNPIAGITAGQNAVVSGTVDDLSITQAQFIYDGIVSTDVIAVDNGTFSFEVSDIPMGTHRIGVKVVDAAGNESVVAERQVVVTAAPILLQNTGDNGEVPNTADEDDTDGDPANQVFTGPIVALGDQSVLGDEDAENQPDTVGDHLNNVGVQGTSDTKKADGVFGLLGLAWYWWLAIVAGVAGLIWLLASLRQRKDEA